MAQWKGLDQLDALIERVDSLPDQLGQRFVKRVKALTPVRTGALQRDWVYVLHETTLTVGNSMPYAFYVEMGTTKFAPRAMLRTAAYEVPMMVMEILGGK